MAVAFKCGNMWALGMHLVTCREAVFRLQVAGLLDGVEIFFLDGHLTKSSC